MKRSKTGHEKKLVSKEDFIVLNMCLIAKTFVVKTSKNCGYFVHFPLNRSPMDFISTLLNSNYLLERKFFKIVTDF